MIVLANGCFDILHFGHVKHLQEARSFGTRLIVSLTEDEFVLKGKGRPLYPWRKRAYVLRALKCVDEVIPTSCAVEAICTIKPDVFVKGIDYVGRDKWQEDVERACNEVGARLMFTTSPKESVTDIIRRTLDTSHS